MELTDNESKTNHESPSFNQMLKYMNAQGFDDSQNKHGKMIEEPTLIY